MNGIVRLHGYLLGFAVVGSWAFVLFWGLALWPLRYPETPTYWRVVSIAQVLLGLQLLVGLVLVGWWLLGGGQPPGANSGGGWFSGTFHLLYGAFFPLVVLLVGHAVARSGQRNPHAVFAVVGLVNFGLTGRAFMVGAGMG
jgi:hypothetical protein